MPQLLSPCSSACEPQLPNPCAHLAEALTPRACAPQQEKSPQQEVMTNLDSLLKIRDITLPTKVHLVKAMVFPVVTYGHESWTIKKLSAEELMLLNCGVRRDS